MKLLYGLMGAMIFFSLGVQAQSASSKGGKKMARDQEVVFEGAEVDGQGRSPDGAYLVQKRGMDFTPLYKVKTALKNNVEYSVEYLR